MNNPRSNSIDDLKRRDDAENHDEKGCFDAAVETSESTCSPDDEEVGKKVAKVDTSSDTRIETLPRASNGERHQVKSGSEKVHPRYGMQLKDPYPELQRESSDDEFSTQAPATIPDSSTPEMTSQSAHGSTNGNQSTIPRNANARSPGAHHYQNGFTSDDASSSNNQEHDIDLSSAEVRASDPNEIIAEAVPSSTFKLNCEFDGSKRLVMTLFILFLTLTVATVWGVVLGVRRRNGRDSGSSGEENDAIESVPTATTPTPTPARNTSFPSTPAPTMSTVVLSADEEWLESSYTLEETNVEFGPSVALSKDGSTVAVGWNGIIQVRRRGGDGNLTPSGEPLSGGSYSGGKYFGGGIALSRDGSRMAIGAGSLDHAAKTGSLSVLDYDEESATWELVGSGLILGSTSEESFGTAVAMSADGSIVAVSAPKNDTNGEDAGAARVYRLEERTWRQMGEDLLGNVAGDEFGTALALSSNGLTLAVGAPQAPRNLNGEVRVFNWNNGTDGWEEGQSFSGAQPLEHFGACVALSANGGILAVGAPFHDVADELADEVTDAGQVRFWDLHSVEHRNIETPLEGKQAHSRFGSSVGLSDDGKTCVVGIAGTKKLDSMNQSIAYSGSVTVYQHAVCTSWSQVGQKNGGRVSHGQGQNSVKVGISGGGDVVVAGDHYSAPSGEDTVELRLYNKEDRDAWEPMGSMLMGSSFREGFGFALALARGGFELVAASPWATRNSAMFDGYAEVHRFDGTEWQLKGQRLEGKREKTYLGYGVALSEDGYTLVLGKSRGKVQILLFNGVNWTTTNELHVAEEGTDDGFAVVVDMSDDGLFLVASDWSSSKPHHLAGSFTVFERETANSTKWSQRGAAISGKVDHEGLGSAIAMSGDGQTIAAAYGCSMLYEVQPGGVRVYSYSAGGAWNQIGQDLTGFQTRIPHSEIQLALNSNGTVLAVEWFILEQFNNNGMVSVYRLSSDGTEWQQLGNPIPGTAVALRDTHEGLVMAVGMGYHDDVHCTDAGMIRVYVWDESMIWQQIGDDIVGEESSDSLGGSVALSPDGMIVAAGGPLASQAGPLFSGMVKVFQRVS